MEAYVNITKKSNLSKYKDNPETCNASGLYYWEISKRCL